MTVPALSNRSPRSHRSDRSDGRGVPRSATRRFVVGAVGLFALGALAPAVASASPGPLPNVSTQPVQAMPGGAVAPQAATPVPNANTNGTWSAPVAPPAAEVAPANLSGANADPFRRGVVQVEQNGRPIGVGSVLGKDGRVLTSLSAVGNAELADIRYADGTVVKARVGHKDKAWDLALLVPQQGKWLEGFVPSNADPQGLELRSYLPRNGKLGLSGVAYRGRVDARSADGDLLQSVLDMDARGSTAVPGAPVLDPEGKVVGVFVHACRGNEPTPKAAGQQPRAVPPQASQTSPDAKARPCSAITVGAPVYALRSFLMKTPATAVQPVPWLGLGGAPTESGNIRGVRVMGVAPGSPAEKAGLKVNAENPDTIVAVDGQPVETPEQLADVIGAHAVGQQVKLLAFSAGKFREVPVTLRAAP